MNKFFASPSDAAAVAAIADASQRADLSDRPVCSPDKENTAAVAVAEAAEKTADDERVNRLC